MPSFSPNQKYIIVEQVCQVRAISKDSTRRTALHRGYCQRIEGPATAQRVLPPRKGSCRGYHPQLSSKNRVLGHLMRSSSSPFLKYTCFSLLVYNGMCSLCDALLLQILFFRESPFRLLFWFLPLQP